MKILFNFLNIILIFFILSCSVFNKTNKKEKLQFGKNKYEISFLNEDYKRQIIFNGNESSEYRFNLADSTVIFVTDSKSASPLISRFLQSKDYLRLIDEDNLKYSFSENENIFLLEKKENIIIGYINASKDNKEKLEKILLTFKKL